MCAARAPGAADCADDRALADTFTADHIQGAHVGVKRLPTIAMVDYHHVAVAPIIPTGVDNYPGVDRIQAFAGRTRHIDAAMIGFG